MKSPSFFCLVRFACFPQPIVKWEGLSGGDLITCPSMNTSAANVAAVLRKNSIFMMKP